MDGWMDGAGGGGGDEEGVGEMVEGSLERVAIGRWIGTREESTVLEDRKSTDMYGTWSVPTSSARPQ